MCWARPLDLTPEDLPSGGDQVPPADEVENTLGVLHSNRSLLLLRQIEAGDQGALQHGAEVAWGLVAKDAGKALAIDRTNLGSGEASPLEQFDCAPTFGG